MKTLTHPFTPRIPPLALTFLVGVGARATAHAIPALRLESVHLAVLAAVFGLLGVACSLLGVVSFRRAHTTLNPMKPAAATTLVVSGIYGFTRNPMYLGFLLLLLGEIAWLGNAAALITAPMLMFYLNHLQIAPEEFALRERFGAEFAAYTARVPRWL